MMDTDQEQGLPVVPHLASEFLVWLWWFSEERGSQLPLDDPEKTVELWIDDRLAFRNPNDLRITAVLTGENPGNSLEARAALSGGKVVQELRMAMSMDDREYVFTLKGTHLDLANAKLPQAVDDGDGIVYDRMFLYEQVTKVIASLYRTFASLRISNEWDEKTVPAIRAWVATGSPSD